MATETQILEALAAVEANGNSRTKAAAALGIPRSTLLGRLNQARRLGMLKDGKPAPAQIVTEADRLKDKVRALESLIATAKRETLDDEYVKREIFGLAEAGSKPRIPGWVIAQHQEHDAAAVPQLMLSDLHWGEVVRPAEIEGLNEYNLSIAQERMRRTITMAIDLLRNHIAPMDFPGFVLVLGGDMVSGDIHEELCQTNEAESIPVVLDLLGVMIWVIDTLVAEFGRVFVPCVTGNHGRQTKKPRAKRRNHTNYDWLLYQLLAKHYADDSRIRFLIPDGPDCSFTVAGYRYLLTHGDQFRAGDSIIGALGPIARGDQKKRSRNMQIGLGYDTILMGHWHQLIQTRRFIVNGTLKGYDEYAFSNNYGFEPAQQALWLTHPVFGIIHQMPVLSEEPRNVAADGGWVTWKDAA